MGKIAWVATRFDEIAQRISTSKQLDWEIEYKIEYGDTLWEISRALKFLNPEKYRHLTINQIVSEIAKKNGIINPNVIYAGNYIKMNLIIENLADKSIIEENKKVSEKIEENNKTESKNDYCAKKEEQTKTLNDKSHQLDIDTQKNSDSKLSFIENIKGKSQEHDSQNESTKLTTMGKKVISENHQFEEKQNNFYNSQKEVYNLLSNLERKIISWLDFAKDKIIEGKIKYIEKKNNPNDNPNDLKKAPRFVPAKRYGPEFFVPYVKPLINWLESIIERYILGQENAKK